MSTIIDKDEFLGYEPYGDDYTIKYYQKEDCKHYAVVVYETDDDSKVIYTCKAQDKRSDAHDLAIASCRKHEKTILKQELL